MKQKQVIRLNESQLRRIVKESVKRILKEDFEDENDQYQGYYYSISSCNKELEDLRCFEEEGGFNSPDEAYNEGLNQLEFYDDGIYKLEVYHFITQSNGHHVGDYDSGYMAVNNHGRIREF